jgi:DNA-binding XRE family transcriptional regulator
MHVTRESLARLAGAGENEIFSAEKGKSTVGLALCML